MSRAPSEWRTIKLAARVGEQRVEARPSRAFEDACADAAQTTADAARRFSDERVAALRDEIAERVRRDLAELRKLPQENRAKRQRVDRALREMQGV